MMRKDGLTRKMTMPSLPPHLVTTERIARLYLMMQSVKTVSINAPAGYGKTVLVASFLNSLPDGNKILWYKIEPEDNRPEAYFSGLIEALIYQNNLSSGRIGETAKNDQEAINYHELVEFACDALWKTYDPEKPKYIHLAFDECQNLDHNGVMGDLLRQLAGNAPPLLKTYFLSRNSSSIIDEKHKLETLHCQISPVNLKFSIEELSTLIKAINYDYIDSAQVEGINLLTEGWIGAALILLQGLKPWKSDKVHFNHCLENDPGIYRYLSLEVFSRIRKKDLEKLSKLSLLHVFTAESAASIFNLHDLETHVLKYPELDMFIHLIGDRPTKYRFHNLIKQYLQNYAKKHFPRPQLAENHFKAAAYYVEHELFSQAIEHIRNCSALEKTIELVTGVGIRFMLVGNSGQFNKWLAMLPRELVSHNPVLLIFKALLLPHNEFKEAENLLQKAYQCSRAGNNSLLLYRAATSLVFISYCKNNMRGIVDITQKTTEDLQMAKNDANSWLSLLGLMHAVGKSDYMQGLEIAGILDISDLQEEDYWLYLAYAAVVFLYLGKPANAEKLIVKALSLNCVEQTEPARATALYLLCFFLAMQNEFGILNAHLTILKQVSEKNGYTFFLAGVQHLSAYDDYLNLKYKNAQAKLDEAVFAYQEFGNRALALLMKMFKRLWSTQAEKEEIVLEEIAWEGEVLKKLKPGLMVEEIYQSIQGALARDRGDFNLAEISLRQSIKRAKRKQAKQVLCGSYFHLAKLYFARGSSKQGCHYLQKAMLIGEGGPYYMLWDLHLPTIVEMLIRAIAHGYCPGYAGEFLKRLFNDNIAAYLAKKCLDLEEVEVLAYTQKLLAELKDNPGKKYCLLKANLFGKPGIEVNGLTIPEAAWKTKKNRGIFEYLLLNRGESVTKDRIIDIFWPESDISSAQTSLRTALYQIRKVLAAHGVECSGINTPLVETPETLGLKANDEVDTDLANFDNLCNSFLRHNEEKSRLVNSDQELLEKIITLYRGELLETRDYGDILIFRREACKTVYEDVCLRLSAIYYEQGQLNRAEAILEKAILADPLSENTCLALIRVYAKTGKRKKAQKLFNDLKVRLKRELNMEPASSLVAEIEKTRI